MWTKDWTETAACKGDVRGALFIEPSAEDQAKLVCEGCPVQTECLADALDNEIESGVWGGMTGLERRMLLRRMPGVPSWRFLLETAEFRYTRPATGKVAAADKPAQLSRERFPASPACDVPEQAKGLADRASVREQRM
jgi:WhiB family redox-sensing transcriptional regulator